MKAGAEKELLQHYLKRLPWRVEIHESEIRKPLASAERKSAEAELLLKQAAKADYLVALDEHGKQLGSRAFAAELQRLQTRGVQHIAFCIGGADGLDETVLKKAGLTLSLGAFTWPHMLVRGMLAEQLYRAHSILTNHPYHRE